MSIENGSFEKPATAQTADKVEGWDISGGVEIVRAGFVPTVIATGDGQQFARFPAAGGTLSQTLANHTVTQGLYTLSFDVADVFRDSNVPRQLTAALVRADTAEVLAALTLDTTAIPDAAALGDPGTRRTLRYFVPARSAAIGKPMAVRFTAGGKSGFAHTAVDRVVLDFDADAAEPARYTLDTANCEARGDEALAGMSGAGADGTEYTVTRNGWYRNGKPWYPVSGEFHYPRYEENEWSRELAKLKAAGVDIVSTYVFWNQHEEPRGTWDWSGRKDLRRFVGLAAEHGLLVWLRVGPYVNAEAANGGIPGFANDGKRGNNPGYMAMVEEYFGRIAAQVSGMYVKDGGPIVGIQLENEYASGDPKHITALKQLAIAKGMVTPYYSVTANSRFEPGTVFPLQGSYVYRGWEGQGGTSAMSGYIFGSDEWSANTDLGGTFYPTLDYPRGYCELGTGSPMRGNSRFQVRPAHVVANAYDCVGRGANSLGYYMFHGGTQRAKDVGGGWGTSYDFQAPLGEFGQMRPSLHQYRRLHSFVRGYADRLVPTRISRDPEQIMDPRQTSRLRYIGRFDRDGRGFLFLNNTQRNAALPTRDDVQIAIKSPAGTWNVPSKPLTMPAERCNIFPFRMDLGGVELRWATVEPLALLRHPGEPPVFVFWSPDWTNREFAFPAGTSVRVLAGSATSREADGTLLVHAVADIRTQLEVGIGSGVVARIVLLTEEESLAASICRIDGRERLVLARGAQVCALAPTLRVEVPAGQSAKLEIFPEGGLRPGTGWRCTPGANGWSMYAHATAPAPAPPEFAPGDNGQWTIRGNPNDWSSLAHAHVRVRYAGGSAQLLASGNEITRDLYHGEDWTIDLKRHGAQIATGLTLKLHPWDDGIAGIAKPAGAMPALLDAKWQPLREVPWNAAPPARMDLQHP